MWGKKKIKVDPSSVGLAQMSDTELQYLCQHFNEINDYKAGLWAEGQYKTKNISADKINTTQCKY